MQGDIVIYTARIVHGVAARISEGQAARSYEFAAIAKQWAKYKAGASSNRVIIADAHGFHYIGVRASAQTICHTSIVECGYLTAAAVDDSEWRASLKGGKA